MQQILAVLDMNLRNLTQRMGSSLVVIVGIACVVGVLLSVLAMGAGIARATAGTGSPDRALVLSADALSEALSSIPESAIPNILGAPGIARDRQGRPIAQPETLAQVQVSPRGGGGTLINLTLRGVGSNATELRPEIHLTAGRMFRSGLHELIVGRNAQAQYAGLNIGDHLSFQSSDWLIVGTFASTRPSLLESELLADATTLQSAFQRNWFASVTVRLAGPNALEQLKKALKADPTLHVSVYRESQYAAQQASGISVILDRVGYFVGGLMAIGAFFGALNTLYAAVSSRSLEIAQLRAMGFSGLSVAISVLAEALLLSITGALVGALIAWLLFNGHMTSTTLGTGQAQTAVAMAVTPALVLLGIIWGCVIGLAGGLGPAIRASSQPVATALRALA